MAFRLGGASLAASHWLMPSSEGPTMPTRPLHQLCRAIHSMASYPSLPYWL
jgi:hypothetical protein